MHYLALEPQVCISSPTRPVVFSIDKNANDSYSADFVLATLTESPTQTHATSSNGMTGHTTTRTLPSSVSMSASTSAVSDVESRAGFASSSEAMSHDYNIRSHDNSSISSQSTTARLSREHSNDGLSSAPDKRHHTETQSDSRRERGQEEAHGPPAPRDPMDRLFDVENADDVMELDPARGREGTSLSDNQFFADFPHQGTMLLS